MNEGESPVTVVAYSELDDGDPEAPVDVARWQALARAALTSEGAPAGELTLVFVGEAEMSDLNEAHMDGSGPTDVLAFPLDAQRPDADALVAEGLPVLLGDVIVCPAVARRNAVGHHRSLDDELALLVVHGVLHVLGHDHAEPAEATLMRSREQALLDAHHR